MDDLLGIVPGDILRLEHRVGQPVQVSVGGIVKFLGDIAAHDNRLAVSLREMTNHE